MKQQFTLKKFGATLTWDIRVHRGARRTQSALLPFPGKLRSPPFAQET